jgi:hypothetical protein
MANYIVGMWTTNLLNQHYLSVGVIAREGEDVAMRVIRQEQLPKDYQPESDISKAIWKDMERIFQERKERSNLPTNLYFSVPKDKFSGTLEEQADQLFQKYVAPGLPN